MKIATSAAALGALLGAVILFSSKIKGDWVSTAIMVGAGFGLIVIVVFVGIRLRHRQRRRLSDMRDSALW